MFTTILFTISKFHKEPKRINLKKPDKDIDEPVKPRRRSLLSKKGKDKAKRKRVLCSSDTHYVRSHHFDLDGFYGTQKIRDVLAQNIQSVRVFLMIIKFSQKLSKTFMCKMYDLHFDNLKEYVGR